jgi:hypothetical protein
LWEALSISRHTVLYFKLGFDATGGDQTSICPGGVCALCALLLIANEPPQEIHQIQELSDRGDIPVKFLEQILPISRNPH